MIAILRNSVLGKRRLISLKQLAGRICGPHISDDDPATAPHIYLGYDSWVAPHRRPQEFWYVDRLKSEIETYPDGRADTSAPWSP
jgi:hypothetical protein